MTAPPRQKITFGEMRASGVRGLLIYCSDFRCPIRRPLAATAGRMRSGCRTSSRASPVRLAGRVERMSGPIGTRPKRMPDWSRPFDDPIPLPRGRQLITLRDAAEYITRVAQGRARRPGMAGRDGSAATCCRAWRPDHVRPDRCHAGAQSAGRAGV